MFLLAVALASTALWGAAPAAQTGSLLFFVDLPPGHTAVEDGRLLLMIAKDGRRGEPRFQIGTGADAQQIFGVDVESWRGRTSVVIDAAVPGFPLNSISNIPPGTYTVQALLHKYETFTRADGFTVKLPMDRGEGQQWAQAPGNLYSTPVEVRVDPNGAAVTITLDKVIPPIAPPTDTRYIKHERIQSALLTKFWGRPMHLGANVLLPEGWDTHPEARYPLFIYHGHFPHTFTGFRPEPPDPNLKPDDVVFDDEGKRGKEGLIDAPLPAAQTAELWMRNLKVSPADFLRQKFRIQAEAVAPTEPATAPAPPTGSAP